MLVVNVFYPIPTRVLFRWEGFLGNTTQLIGITVWKSWGVFPNEMACEVELYGANHEVWWIEGDTLYSLC